MHNTTKRNKLHVRISCSLHIFQLKSTTWRHACADCDGELGACAHAYCAAASSTMMKMLCRTLLLLCTLPQFSIGYRQFSGMKAEFKVREEDKNKGYIYFMTIRQSGEMPRYESPSAIPFLLGHRVFLIGLNCRAVPSLCPPHWCSLSVDDEMWTGNKLTVIFSITVRPKLIPLPYVCVCVCVSSWSGRWNH